MSIITKTFAAVAFAGLALVASVDASAAPVRHDGAHRYVARHHHVVHHRHVHHRPHHRAVRRVAVRAY